jgi:hypothetical protein
MSLFTNYNPAQRMIAAMNKEDGVDIKDSMQISP